MLQMADYFIGAIKYNRNMKQELQRYRTTTRGLSLTRSPRICREPNAGFEPSPCSLGRLSIGHCVSSFRCGKNSAELRVSKSQGSTLFSSAVSSCPLFVPIGLSALPRLNSDRTPLLGWFLSLTTAYDIRGRCRRQKLFLAYYSLF
jgi:hypothetical protein